jgi:hypothetical protein
LGWDDGTLGQGNRALFTGHKSFNIEFIIDNYKVKAGRNREAHK